MNALRTFLAVTALSAVASATAPKVPQYIENVEDPYSPAAQITDVQLKNDTLILTATPKATHGRDEAAVTYKIEFFSVQDADDYKKLLTNGTQEFLLGHGTDNKHISSMDLRLYSRKNGKFVAVEKPVLHESAFQLFDSNFGRAVKSTEEYAHNAYSEKHTDVFLGTQ